jgi:hypothetical protein
MYCGHGMPWGLCVYIYFKAVSIKPNLVSKSAGASLYADTQEHTKGKLSMTAWILKSRDMRNPLKY